MQRKLKLKRIKRAYIIFYGKIKFSVKSLYIFFYRAMEVYNMLNRFFFCRLFGVICVWDEIQKIEILWLEKYFGLHFCCCCCCYHNLFNMDTIDSNIFI